MTYPYKSRIGSRRVESTPGEFVRVMVREVQCPICQEWKLKPFWVTALYECLWCGEEFRRTGSRHWPGLGPYLERLP